MTNPETVYLCTERFALEEALRFNLKSSSELYAVLKLMSSLFEVTQDLIDFQSELDGKHVASTSALSGNLKLITTITSHINLALKHNATIIGFANHAGIK